MSNQLLPQCCFAWSEVTGQYSSGNIYFSIFWFLQEIKEALFRKRQELKMTIMSLKFSLAVNEEVNVAEF